MTRRKKVLITSLITVAALLVLPPLLAPVIHDHDSPRSALREALYKNGHPYQSFTAFIQKSDYIDETYGQLYNVYWYNFNSPTGDTATLCYANGGDDEGYEVSCGTGP
ncbi:hypothetical protein [Bacillus sp. KH172YL63]|uniref:hypothetical protein n=1 Tax=Bacillus sp. KH172YL63 TaxID=2709784 RepID=UPI0013E4ABF5|nr:hypothetical protein [Bacillus sp. KH172YL63]BCB05139.1 hypothetical protein KH172YL63_32720 [Bacillus sp. KH172YL63]